MHQRLAITEQTPPEVGLSGMYYADVGYGTGEYTVRGTGVTYSNAEFDARFADQIDPGIEPETIPLWLERETVDVLQELARGNVILQGDIGAGKSTVLRGVRAALREAGQPYVLIDGHYVSKHAGIAEAIGEATKRGDYVMVDSWDYFWVNRRNKMAVTSTRQQEARQSVASALQAHVAAGGRVLLTIHTDPWLRTVMTDEGVNKIHAFDASLGVSPRRVFGMLDQTEFMSIFANKCGAELAEAYWKLVEASSEPTARSYRVTNVVAHGDCGALAEIIALGQAGFDATVRQVDAKTRALMEIGGDYSLLPD